MIAEYKGNYYFVNKNESDLVLFTYNPSKAAVRNFERGEYGNYFKEVKIEDKNVVSLYELKFYAECTEEENGDNVYGINGKNTAVSMMKGKIVISVPENNKTVFRSVAVSDCKGFYVERHYIKQGGHILNETHIAKAKIDSAMLWKTISMIYEKVL